MPGLAPGQAPSFVLGATCWRVLALHALGRWDEALVEAVRAERAWQESELRAPWYAINGFLAAFTIARGRGDPVGADRWRGVVIRIEDGSDAEVRTRRLIPYVNDDLEALARDVIGEFRVFAGRQDYVHLTLGFLADHRQPVEVAVLDDLLAYTDERELRLVSAQARRLRGILARQRGGPRAGARGVRADGGPAIRCSIAHRARRCSGAMAPWSTAGLDELEQLGDVEQAARVAAERRAGGLAAAPTG